MSASSGRYTALTGMPDGESLSSGLGVVTRAGSGAKRQSRAYRPHRGKLAGAFDAAAQHRARGIDIVLAADEEWGPLVQLRRLNVEDTLSTVGRRPTSLLDDERKRVRLIEEPQLSALVLPIGRVRE